MEDNIAKYEDRNSLIRKIERFVLKIMIFLIIPAVIAYIFFPNPRILNSLSTWLSLTALVQLEVCGLFGYMDFLSEELNRIYEESDGKCVPSNLSRAIFEFYNPEPGIRNFFNNQLYFNKKLGFYLLFASGILQLYVNFFI